VIALNNGRTAARSASIATANADLRYALCFSLCDTRTGRWIKAR